MRDRAAGGGYIWLSTALRRPVIDPGAGAAHQRCPLAFGQAVGKAEWFDGLFEVDDRKRTGPVGAPQAAVDAPGVEDAGERVPDVREGIGFLRKRTGAADL